MIRTINTFFFTGALLVAAGLAPVASARDAGERSAPPARTADANLVADLDSVKTDAITFEAPAERTPHGRNCARVICERPGR